MRIGELARRSGLRPSAIRYYEQVGLLPRAVRRSGRRDFDDQSQAVLAVVQLAKETGFTLAEIRRLLTEFGEQRWRRLADRKLAEIRATVERLGMMTVLLEKLLRCKCPDVEFCGRVIRRNAAVGKARARAPAS
ncbi:MAG TPA: MerR family transcriptional regulator [Thermoanaerobaculia bacterium]|nr:MerR family transcriptional regulator [Thermoanaerobaculia bacterium]